MNPNAPERIVPRGVRPDSASVRSFEFAVRTILDYDANFLQDRLCSSIFVNGEPTGVYSCLKVDDDIARSPAQAIERYGPALERSVVDEFMGLGYRKTVRELEARVNALQAHINRPRWWQFRPLRRAFVNARAALASIIAPRGRP